MFVIRTAHGFVGACSLGELRDDLPLAFAHRWRDEGVDEALMYVERSEGEGWAVHAVVMVNGSPVLGEVVTGL